MNIKHGMTGTPEHKTWSEIKQRCHNPKNTKFRWYGARGIEVCEEWRRNFLAFYAYVGKRPEGCELDRIDNNKGYMPGNVRWTTRQVNVRNRRNTRKVFVDGRMMLLEDYAKEAGIEYATAWARLTKHPHLIQGKPNHKIGERNGMAKLSNEQADEIRTSTEGTKTLQERYGVSRSLIQGIRRGDFRKVT